MARPGAAVIVGLVVLAGAAVGLAANHFEANRRLEARARALTGGDPDRGRTAMAQRPCGGCHTIPGVPGAKAKVGPSLAGFSGRLYIGGRLANTPDNVVQWLRNPHAVDPQSAMPPMGIGEQEARDMAAYLETLK